MELKYLIFALHWYFLPAPEKSVLSAFGNETRLGRSSLQTLLDQSQALRLILDVALQPVELDLPEIEGVADVGDVDVVSPHI